MSIISLNDDFKCNICIFNIHTVLYSVDSVNMLQHIDFIVK